MRDGPEAEKDTLAGYRAQGYTRVQVRCGRDECHHSAKAKLTPAFMPCPAFSLAAGSGP